MSKKILDRTTLEEKLVWYGLILSYPAYALGAMYILGSLIGWIILSVYLLRRFLDVDSQNAPLPILVWVWVLGMLSMELALVQGHLNYDLGLAKIIKSTIGWAKGWALLALFIALGAVLPLKRAIIPRACCVIGLHSLIFTILSALAFIVGLPGDIYVSPLKVVGGPGPEYFELKLFGINPETGLPRWQYFAPWSPAIGLQSCMLLILCLHERNLTWKCLGVLGSFTMCCLAQSRAGWVIFFTILPMVFVFSRLHDPKILFATAVAFVIVALPGQVLIEQLQEMYQRIKESRPDSTRVRGGLANLAVQRWTSEAPVWGHGIVEPGPKYVERMMIGTHHSWYGLLFVKGLVGALSLAIPLFITSVYLLVKAQRSKDARAALGILVVLTVYSFFENLEILAYLYWPALLWLGASLRVCDEKERDMNSDFTTSEVMT